MATIDYVLNENIAPLFLHHPDIDHLITFSEKDLASFSNYRKKIRQIVKNNAYDVIIDTRSTIRTLFFCLFSLATPYRIGKKKSYNYVLQNYRVDNHFDGTNDAVDMNLRLLHPLAKAFPIQYERNFKLYVTAAEKEQFRQYMQRQGIDFRQPVIVCAVTARLRYKIWDKERMKELLFRILNQYNCQLIFNFGGKEEQLFAQQLQEEMDHHPRIFTRIEAHDLREVAAMFANVDFFLGNEGGPRHISQALDIPSFAIYPPGIEKKEWLPNANERFQGIQASDISEQAVSRALSFSEKFELITVDAVWNKLNPMLKKLSENFLTEAVPDKVQDIGEYVSRS
ncbi:MAG: glycosyltransferase family 9 protein [Dysgonamonadaceae bacterium]|jgi:heptosyltransferase-2|nr:glycosyltransferase family 9 protein [Dysgonamonadaceae bacterium]